MKEWRGEERRGEVKGNEGRREEMVTKSNKG